jgi:hypothetical protein
MLRFLVGIFVILHGLVHLWYVVLSQRLVEFQAEMGWTGRSWLLTGLIGDSSARLLASVVYALAAVAFIGSGIGLFTEGDWWRPIMVGSAIFSAAVVLVFWDGSAGLLVQKGLIGLLIDLGIIFWVLVLKWPAVQP